MPSAGLPKRTPIAVAVSGGGRSLENLLTASEAQNALFRVAGVISSRPDCRAVEIATRAQIPTFIADFAPPVERNQPLLQSLLEFLGTQKVNLVVLAGFLKPYPVTPEWQGRIINIHPALLPKHGGKGMYGLKVHRAVLAAGDLKSGATVHAVTPRYDDGAILGQAIVSIDKITTPEELANRVFAAECDLYPCVINALISGALSMTSPLPLVYEFG